MSIKELKDAMLLAKKIKEIKEQEYLLAEAQYNLHMAEIELQKQLNTMERTNHGADAKIITK